MFKKNVVSKNEWQHKLFIDSLDKEGVVSYYKRSNSFWQLSFIIMYLISVITFVVCMVDTMNTYSEDYVISLSQKVCDDNGLGNLIHSEKYENDYVIVTCEFGDVRWGGV